ncbi:hypothetical protein [Bacillus sp. NPDC094106]|uniref:hypothetical protein n=1 Tax=Bacillus sp. NPDC094106 TaxID=3363949 RepID=UPI00382210AF
MYMKLSFWMLYIVGGLFFILFTYKANKTYEENQNSLLGLFTTLNSFRLIILGESIWLICWIIGIVIYPNHLTFALGILPVLMPLTTFFSVFLLKYHELQKNHNSKTKKRIKHNIKNWEAELPIDIKVKRTIISVDQHKEVINGRITIYLKGRDSSSEVDWLEYGYLLEGIIKHPIIVQIHLNEEVVYP